LFTTITAPKARNFVRCSLNCRLSFRDMDLDLDLSRYTISRVELDAWQEAGFQTVKVNTRALTPPLLSFNTSSQPSAPLQMSTPVTTLTTSSSHSQTPGFETLPTVIGIFIGMVFMAGFFYGKKKKKGYSYRR